MSSIQDDNRPPVFPKWRHWYWLVAGLLLLQVILYHYFTRVFS
jgi:hypothetical protein